jgi:antitoxin HigA-1
MSTGSTSNNITEIPAAAEPAFGPTHPGEVLREALAEGLGLSVSAAARRIGVSRQMLHDILAGRRAVTAEMALRLERLGAASADLLLRLQDDWELASARSRLAEQLEAIEPARSTAAWQKRPAERDARATGKSSGRLNV